MSVAHNLSNIQEMHLQFREFVQFAGSAFADCFIASAAGIAQAFATAAKDDSLRDAKTGGALSHFDAPDDELMSALRACCAPDANDCRFAACGKRLALLAPWRAAGGGKMPAVGACELIGPQGISECNSHRAGLFFQPAQLFYDWHRHAAEEIYLPLCGDAQWHAAKRPPLAAVALKDFVHHPSWQPHACQTFAAPLLAIWTWSGDIAIETYEFCPAPAQSDRMRRGVIMKQ